MDSFGLVTFFSVNGWRAYDERVRMCKNHHVFGSWKSYWKEKCIDVTVVSINQSGDLRHIGRCLGFHMSFRVMLSRIIDTF